MGACMGALLALWALGRALRFLEGLTCASKARQLAWRAMGGMWLLSLPAVLAAGESGFRGGQWPLVALKQPALPAVRHGEWAREPIDLFILAELEQKDLLPSAPADRRTLLRRLSFDLTGLPPTPEEVEAFVADPAPDAYERLVDRLLASPRLGERWARHWLDVVRYADTAGFKRDPLRPAAFRYRDYVIRALNADLPYDRFVQQQLAGDELEPENPEALVATGFLRLYAEESTAADFVKQRQDVLDDVTEVTGLAFLGMTLGCAKCHDHKFDPIEQEDFFRLEACFSAMVPRDDLPLAPASQRAAYERQEDQWEAATAEIRRQMDEIIGPVREAAIREVTLTYDAATRQAWLTPEPQRTTHQRQLVALSWGYVNNIVTRRIARLEGEAKARYEALQRELAKFDALRPPPLPTVMAVSNGDGPPPPTHVLEAGDYRKPEEEVTPGFPSALGPPAPSPGDKSPSGARSALARWLTRPDHPLTLRVIANRLWQHHFGRGIVATSNDFGSMGEPPTHPALLDALAVALAEHGGSLKYLHRRIVTSSTYRQSSRVDPSWPAHQRGLAVDPSNKLLWHARRQRLTAEAVRDALLAVSGQLDLTMYGPAVYPPLPPAVEENSRYAWSPDPVPANRVRRSIYTIQMRNLRHPLLAALDQPDLYLSCGVRSQTLTPTQSLALLNGLETTQAAAVWAGRLLASTFSDEELVHQAWYEALARPPTREELSLACQFLTEQAQRIYDQERDVPTASQPQPLPPCLEPHRAAAYVDLCHALLNATEFLFVD
jgi:hypothetical protein